MDRQIVYPGAIPLDTDLLGTERNVMIAIGYLAQAALGTNTVADGLACVPTQPASMTVSIGPGSITQYGAVDTLPFGSLPAEPTLPLVRMGTNLLSTDFVLTAPTGAGEAIDYLIEGSLLESDATPVVLPYYNAANPSQPYSGPGGDGASQMTQRLQQVQLQLKAGAAAPVGSQQVPAVDAGWAGLYVITVQAGQTEVAGSNISQLPSAPFLPWKLPQLSPGTRNLAAFTPASQGAWTVPNGVGVIKVRLWGGGGAGGAGFGGGGGGGGYSEGFYAVSAGQSFTVSVGNGGVGAGTSGGASSFGSLASAAGGGAGSNGTAGGVGVGAVNGGSATGAGFTVAGQPGGAGLETGAFALGGCGGGAFGGPGAASVAAVTGAGAASGLSCALGGGGSGGVFGGVGGQGGPGLVLVEW